MSRFVQAVFRDVLKVAAGGAISSRHGIINEVSDGKVF